MGVLKDLQKIIEKSQEEYERIRGEEDLFFVGQTEVIQPKMSESKKNQLVHGDNLRYMNHLLSTGMEGKLDLIYIDPPFFSGAHYLVEIKMEKNKKERITLEQKAYSDIWAQGMENYLTMIAVRLFFMKDLLAETGTIFVHLDWHSSHYVKVIMDEIFGEDRFVNEIIWQYKSGGVSNRRFARKHDTILFYAKSDAYYFQPQKEKSYNREFKPYRFKGVAEYKDEKGWYTLVNMKDVWQIDMVGRTSKERTGYATQKPKAIMERLIESCSKEGDLCADFFCGSGTLPMVATAMDRNFLACDNGKLAILKAHRRLKEQGVSFHLVREKEMLESTSSHFHAKIDVEKNDEKEKSTIVSLNGIIYDNFNILGIDKKHISSVQSFLEEDFSKLIEYWCIDCDYNGEQICPTYDFFRDKEGIKTQTMIEQDLHVAAIKVVDVFGNEAVHIWKSGE